MKLLLVHQNFPGQFRDLGPALCDRGHELKAIGSSQRVTDPRIEVLRYECKLGERQEYILIASRLMNDLPQ